MNVIELTRQLGEAIQQDEKYIAFTAAKRANDEDMALNALIGKLNLVQMAYQNESGKESPDEQKLSDMDKEFQSLYGEIMLNENMKHYEARKQELDDMMNYLIGILSQCVNGADPATCEPVSESGDCTGSCSTCGGCG
ncbi:MAG: YlbF family regulator [Clostridia bacterium]|nr:YlbF family regulator [Clostridia bacterium]